MNFDSLSAEHDKGDFRLIKYEHWELRSIAFTYPNQTVGCAFDVTAISVSWNNHLQQPGSLCQLPQLYNKKEKYIFMFMRYVLTTIQNLEA